MKKKKITNGQIKHWRRISKAHDLKKHPSRNKKTSPKKIKVPIDKNWWYLR